MMDKLLFVFFMLIFFCLLLPLTIMMGILLWWTLADFAMSL